MSNVEIIQDIPYYDQEVPKVNIYPRVTRAATARKRDWDKYIKANRFSGDCQLATAVNAYYFLTGKNISTKEYNDLAKKTCCKIGARQGNK